jgi:type II restriction enzyme
MKGAVSLPEDIFKQGSDINETQLLRKSEKLLNTLLKDHTTEANIKWGTDSYINHGYLFDDNQEITMDLITGWYDGFIRPRAEKELDI